MTAKLSAGQKLSIENASSSPERDMMAVTGSYLRGGTGRRVPVIGTSSEAAK